MTSTLIRPILLGLVAIVGPVTRVYAQAAPPPVTPITPPAGGTAGGVGGAGTVLLILLVLLVIVGIGVKMYDLKRKRESEAVHLQAQISDALLREPALFGVPITPTAKVPTWRGSPAVIEVAGQVPAAEMKDTALRIIQGEAARIRSDFVIEDRLAVVPTMERERMPA